MTPTPDTPPTGDSGANLWHIAALYRFAPIPDPAARQAGLKTLCAKHNIKGTLLIAPEGINGTIAAPTRGGIEAAVAHIAAWPEIAARAKEDGGDMEVKYATSTRAEFLRMKVRLKKEIVTMGMTHEGMAHEGMAHGDTTGTYVAPRDWNALISRDDVLVIDVRNDYETRIGMFEGAMDPATETFGAFPEWADGLAANELASNTSGDKKISKKKIAPKKIAMYCTGGIRCEKASAYMKQIGFDEVYHLKGGILKYLEEIPEAESLWRGECFVFDNRVALRHNLTQGEYDTLCGGCKQPLCEADRAHTDYERGVACRHCAGHTTEARRARFRERQRQIDMAEARGEKHMGEAQSQSYRKRKP